MNAQLLNLNSLFQPSEAQPTKKVSVGFDLSDNSFSKTFDAAKSKLDNTENTRTSSQNPPQASAQTGDFQKTDKKTANAALKKKQSSQYPEKTVKTDNSDKTIADNNKSEPVQPENVSTGEKTDIEAPEKTTELTSVPENVSNGLVQAENETTVEEMLLNAVDITVSEEITAQNIVKTAESADSDEKNALLNQKRINNLKTSSATTVSSISSGTDDLTNTQDSGISSGNVEIVEVEEGLQIKASEKVEQAAKDGAVSQTKELSSQAKQTAMDNLQSIQGTDTTVVESMSSTQSDSGSGNDSGLAQGNAAEQIIKMSIENVDSDNSVPVQNFSAHVDKAASTAASSTRTFDLNKADILNQIGTKMQDLPESGQSKVTIILKPEHLGRIQLEILNTGEGITARMLTENQQVKELLDKNMETLKSQLGAQVGNQILSIQI